MKIYVYQIEWVSKWWCLMTREQLGHNGGTSAHFEDRNSDQWLTTAPLSLLFKKKRYIFIYLFYYCLRLVNTWKINVSTFQNSFVQCQHFQTNVFFKLGETISPWGRLYIFEYHSSDERLSEGSEYQCWTPRILSLNPQPLTLQPFSREWCSSLSVSERTEYSR